MADHHTIDFRLSTEKFRTPALKLSLKLLQKNNKIYKLVRQEELKNVLLTKVQK